MVSYWCAWLRNELMDAAFSNAAFPSTGTLYIGLATADGGGITGEPAGSNYGRVAVVNNAALWPASSGGAKNCNLNVVFNAATGSWGTPTVYFISDAATGNTNTWLYGPITNSRAIGSGDIVYFAINADINISLT
jgi:hypothetical protein